MTVETKRVALVTGASSGIGEAAAHELLAAGFAVYGTGRRAVAGEKRDGVVFLPLDVTDDGSVAAAVGEVLDRSGRIDVLVNNAGFGIAGAAEESSVEQAQALFDTNLFGAIRMTRAVLPQMRKQGSGRVINLSSVLGWFQRRSGRCMQRPSTPWRGIPSHWTMRSGSMVSGCCWSNPRTPGPRSIRTPSPPINPFRSTQGAVGSPMC